MGDRKDKHILQYVYQLLGMWLPEKDLKGAQ